jgi:cell division protein FtsB
VSDRHRTASIPRPAGARRSARDAERSPRLADLTRPVARSRQLVTGRGKRALIGAAAGVVFLALIAALFVLPVKAWMRQRDDLTTKQHQLDVLTAANDELQTEVVRLQTRAGAIEAAREQIGVVAPGEQRVTVLPAPAAPVALPAGWPYDAVTQIIAVRSATPVSTPASIGSDPPVDTATDASVDPTATSDTSAAATDQATGDTSPGTGTGTGTDAGSGADAGTVTGESTSTVADSGSAPVGTDAVSGP